MKLERSNGDPDLRLPCTALSASVTLNAHYVPEWITPRYLSASNSSFA